MNLLLINQFFAPDPAPTGQLLADVARVLAGEGHSVRVLCSRSSYQDFDKVGEQGLEQVTVRRTGGLSFGQSRLSRLCSYGSFFLSALVCTMFQRRADVIVTLTTPPLLSLVGTLAKRVRGSRHLIWEMDIYPDVAVDVGVIQAGRVLDRSVGVLADFSRRQADGIITLGMCMRDRLVVRGIDADKIQVVENWADGSVISPRAFPVAGPLVLMYSGNLGRAHDVETIAAAVPLLPDAERFQFVFAGGGSRRARLQACCEGQSNTNFLTYQSHSGLAEHLGHCHIGLVTQNSATCGSVVPSKTYSLMAAGRPFIFIGPSGSTPARLIERFHCGWHVQPGDSKGLVNLLILLQSSPAQVYAAGERARAAFLHSGNLHTGTLRIMNILTSQEPANLRVKSAAAGA